MLCSGLIEVGIALFYGAIIDAVSGSSSSSTTNVVVLEYFNIHWSLPRKGIAPLCSTASSTI